jgi:hypothetical protein
MKGLRAILAIVGLIIGVYLILGGQWLLWDWINSIVNGPWLNWDKFCSGWVFYAPLFLYKWTCQTWTGPFDLSKLWLDLGLFLAIISAFALGYYARPYIKRLKE